jgi:hypothetical protein
VSGEDKQIALPYIETYRMKVGNEDIFKNTFSELNKTSDQNKVEDLDLNGAVLQMTKNTNVFIGQILISDLKINFIDEKLWVES